MTLVIGEVPQEILSAYYRERFPYDFMVHMLTHGGVDPEGWSLAHREQGLCIATNFDDLMRRYQAPADAAEWRQLLGTNTRRLRKVDVGAVYYAPPAAIEAIREGRKLADMVARRELVFDVDLNDYRDVRFCCGSTATCCTACWPLAHAAAVLLDALLRADLQCTKVAWFFSGRRGLHCWVCDEKCALLTDERRSRLLLFIEGERSRLLAGGEPTASVERAARTLHASFERFVAQHRLFVDATRRAAFLGDLALPAAFVRTWEAAGEFTFASMTSICTAMLESRAERHHLARRRHVALEVLLKCFAPRLDAGVTRDRAHFIKLPFSVHPKTGFVCTPLTLDEVRTFVPERDALHVTRCDDARMATRIAVAERALLLDAVVADASAEDELNDE